MKKLLTGDDGPIDAVEFFSWAAYYRRMADLERQALEEAKNKPG